MDSRGNTIFKWEYVTALLVAAGLVAAKLVGALDWAWFTVLAPLWIMAGLALVATLAGAAFCRFGTPPVIAGPPMKRLRWRRRRRLSAARRRIAAHPR